MKLRKYFLLSCLLFTIAAAQAQQGPVYKYIDAQHLSKSGQWPKSTENYYRIQAAERQALTKAVQTLSLNPAGISITFQTNSKNIAAKWKLNPYRVMGNMSPLGVSGLDLYGWNGKKWQFAGVGIPSKDENSRTLIGNLDGQMRHYKIYLPLYTELGSLEIGVDESAEIKPAAPEYLNQKKVVIYGSSITQGASASRPGMAYPSILSRKINVETINLGFSGNGKMEIEIADLLAAIPADVYVMDCVPNPSPEEIKERSYPLIAKLRRLKPDVPIVMVESIQRQAANWDNQAKTRLTSQNAEFKTSYDRLIKEKYKGIYYIKSAELIGSDHEATTDGTHLSDLGFLRMAERVAKELKGIL
ncbi:MAG TPA: SGNH/GDSL hydrolase family protein [Pedobacter sp.]|uniref:SGNH/GDSL hydrolase family protein n=1 Tax=Pedobacter sp. TaxID=1411316 RepID=UPI002C6AC8AE|nr:SGNH/GDSL hydrolase family protein [Pedobacter sp.]HMI04572.1 SGNH/GDSL hydrolase family protein [Pedobacter sp.]